MKKFLIVISILCIIGGVVLIAFSGLDFVNDDWESIFDGLDYSKHVEKSFVADQLTSNAITLQTDLHDSTIIVGFADLSQQNLLIKINYPDTEKNKCTVGDIENNVLKITQKNDANKWFSWGMFQNDNFVEIILDNSLLDMVTLDLETQAGAVRISDGSFQQISIKVSAGSIRLTNVNSKSKVTASTDAGSIRCQDSVAVDFDLKSHAGSITCKGLTATTITLNNNAGSINCEDSTADKLVANNSAGSISCEDLNIPDIRLTSNAGSIRGEELLNVEFLSAKNNTGSINLEIVGLKEQYTLSVKKGKGSCNVENKTGTTDKRIEVSNDFGSIRLNFEDHH